MNSTLFSDPTLRLRLRLYHSIPSPSSTYAMSSTPQQNIWIARAREMLTQTDVDIMTESEREHVERFKDAQLEYSNKQMQLERAVQASCDKVRQMEINIVHERSLLAENMAKLEAHLVSAKSQPSALIEMERTYDSFASSRTGQGSRPNPNWRGTI